MNSTMTWIMSGKPLRPARDLKIIHDICKSNKCGKYKEFNEEDSGVCLACGCPVNLLSDGFRNKIARGNEHCPEGLW